MRLDLKAIEELKEIKKDFWTNVRIPGEKSTLNIELEKALRLADFIEMGELMARDALNRESLAEVTSVLNTRLKKVKL